ncbi:hypothetical protein COMA2_20279 [Candidatus Nitrospira nitrificans]|uniref:Uncharacterized protein n=1 Tax=Candidatus Nitrospira nitrificans TaxID=1742973 RepID=A0A0S4LHP2_9BACT|nr:hypothetical protein COMA2_20279 [Candidatus Nitrospira nitrificans]
MIMNIRPALARGLPRDLVVQLKEFVHK